MRSSRRENNGLFNDTKRKRERQTETDRERETEIHTGRENDRQTDREDGIFNKQKTLGFPEISEN
jgi:hypothetical protein